MAYEILSIGDGEMLANAFQGVAMMFGGGHLEKIMKSGFILGTTLISMRYLTEQEFPLHHVLVGITVYSIMFIPTDTVTIEDVYTGDVRVVANVPLGVAMPMSVISTMGVTMTELFETAFSTPSEASLLNDGYLSALNTLIKLRHIGIGTTGSNAGWDGDISKTINAYIENCVMFDIELTNDTHEVTTEALQKSPDLWDAMKTTFINIDIMTYFPSKPEGQQRSCNDAYEAMTNYFNDSGNVDKNDGFVAAILGIKDPAQRADDKIDQAAAALSMVGFDSQKFMRNALLASYLKDGPSAFIMRTGQEQLNLQWASEQGMFNEIARPLMAFVEMFTVAISPIVAFLTTLGPIGMTMMVRYVQMMLWIALWGPLMAVCNLYITIVTTRALKVVADNAAGNGSGIEAMINHDRLYQELETWLSAGGMLASSVPALSLMIVYGGSVAATNLSGKMTSGASSSVNPSRLMPEPVSMGASMQLGSMSEQSANVGAKKGGMADSLFSNSSMLNKSKQSSSESALSAGNSLQKTVSNMKQSTQRSGTMDSQTDALMSGITHTGTSGSGWSNTNSDTGNNTIKAGSKESESIKATAQAGMSAGVDGKLIGAAAGAKVMADTGASAERANELSNIVSNQLSTMGYGGNATATTNGSSSTSSNQTFSGTEESSAQAKQFVDQAQKAETAMQKYQETSAMQDSWGKSSSIPYQDLARRLSDSGAIVDINSATQDMKSNMSDSAYQKLVDNAAHEINKSSAQDIMGADRQALAGFLMLNEADPVAAAEIMNNHLTPSSSGSGVSMSPDEYKGQKKSPDDIMSKDEADGIKAFAHDGEVSMGTVPAFNDGSGESSGSNNQEGANESVDSASSGETLGANSSKKNNDDDGDVDGNSSKTAIPQMATHSGHSPKAATDHNTPKTQGVGGGKSSKPSGQSMPKVDWAKDPQESDAQPQGGHSPSVSQKVDNAVNSADISDRASLRDKIDKGGKLNSDQRNGTAMLKNTASLEADAVSDIAVDSASAGNDFLNKVQENFNATLKTSADEFKAITGQSTKEKSSNELPHSPSDNDLPPTPKD